MGSYPLWMKGRDLIANECLWLTMLDSKESTSSLCKRLFIKLNEREREREWRCSRRRLLLLYEKLNEILRIYCIVSDLTERNTGWMWVYIHLWCYDSECVHCWCVRAAPGKDELWMKWRSGCVYMCKDGVCPNDLRRPFCPLRLFSPSFHLFLYV